RMIRGIVGRNMFNLFFKLSMSMTSCLLE
ncbi:unnamed protein product, partial [Onchocerca ochengi]